MSVSDSVTFLSLNYQLRVMRQRLRAHILRMEFLERRALEVISIQYTCALVSPVRSHESSNGCAPVQNLWKYIIFTRLQTKSVVLIRSLQFLMVLGALPTQ